MMLRENTRKMVVAIGLLTTMWHEQKVPQCFLVGTGLALAWR